MDFRQRLEQSRVQLVGSEAASEIEDDLTCPYFAIDRAKNPLCLELRLADGSRKAIPYSYFTELNFDPDAGIEILAGQKRICITGRNLARLYDSLIIYRVRYIHADMGQDTQEDGVFVEEILVDGL